MKFMARGALPFAQGDPAVFVVADDVSDRQHDDMGFARSCG